MPVAGPIVSPIDVAAAFDNRDSLAKTIYSRLFDWLVAKVNTSIGQDATAPTLVGVLDIYGECCQPDIVSVRLIDKEEDRNAFEQLISDH